MRRWLVPVAIGAFFLTACAGPPNGNPSPAAIGDTSTDSPSEWSGVTRNVPADFPTIQSAVDAAGPGDLVLVDRGVYKETVNVTTPGLTIRGVDRNEVILDGEFERSNGVEVLFADGVVVENMTAMNYKINGFFWTGVRGYRGSYLTAINNGDYGVYAFDSGDGLFEHSYGTGSPDAAFYIGQCNPCDAVISDSVGEYSGLGYSGSNASTELYLIRNVFRYNGAGIAPNSWDGELLPPVENVVMAGNLVHGNGSVPFPHHTAQYIVQGNGIVLAGTENSTVIRNRVFNHEMSGILLHPNIDKNVWMAGDNTVQENVVTGSGLADLTMAGPSQDGNCFSGNEFDSSMPPPLEFRQPCSGLRIPSSYAMGPLSALFGRLVEANLDLDPEVFYGDMPHPEPQEQMPGGVEAPVVPAVNVFASAKPDLDTVEVPPMPSDLEVTQQKGFNIMGVTFASVIGGFLGLYAYVLPLALYAAWVGIALWEIMKRDDLSHGAGIGWMFAIFVIPFLGVIAYYIFGGSQLPKAYKWTLLAGGLGVYVLFLALGLVVGGIA
ncbi:MAG TPA: PLDc N-terminal domain-containing protein [Acidimicrobiia bacterium]